MPNVRSLITRGPPPMVYLATATLLILVHDSIEKGTAVQNLAPTVRRREPIGLGDIRLEPNAG